MSNAQSAKYKGVAWNVPNCESGATEVVEAVRNFKGVPRRAMKLASVLGFESSHSPVELPGGQNELYLYGRGGRI